MEQKAKFIIIGLIGGLVIALFLAVQNYSGKQTAEREREDLKRENTSLVKKVEATLQDAQRIEERANSLSSELERVSQEKDELQRRFDMLNKEREALVQKIKAQPAAPAQPQMSISGFKGMQAVDEAYWAGVLKANTDLGLQLGIVRNELKGVQIKNEELQRIKNTLELEIANLGRDKQDLGRQLEYNKKMLDTITADLVREKNDKFTFQQALKAIRSENTILRRQLSSLNNRKIDLENKIQQIQMDKANLEEKFVNLETILKGKVEEICRLKEQLNGGVVAGRDINSPAEENKESVDLPPIVVRPSQEGMPQDTGVSTLTGKVLAVNKDNNFVVVDLGADAGVKMGDTFRVYRQDTMVGSVEVIQVRPDISACDINTEQTPIKIGDTVK